MKSYTPVVHCTQQNKDVSGNQTWQLCYHSCVTGYCLSIVHKELDAVLWLQQAWRTFNKPLTYDHSQQLSMTVNICMRIFGVQRVAITLS